MLPSTVTADLLYPDWPAPVSVRAVSTTRAGGVSSYPWNSLNLASHVGDDQDAVNRNRQLLAVQANLPQQPAWLTQVHGCTISSRSAATEADGRYSRLNGEVCAVLTADCLPVLLCSADGRAVAAVHAGWRGLAAGILENAVAQFDVDATEIMAWMGPAIGPRRFEVGGEVREAFVTRQPVAESAFRQVDQSHWLADIYALAKFRLQAVGVHSIYGGGYCTVTDQQRFFSYRRDGVTGRMASLIWIQEEQS